MKLFEKKKKALIVSFFLIILVTFSILMWILGGYLNAFFNGILLSYRIIIQDIRIPLLKVVIAPINEEIVKFLGYSIIFLFSAKSVKVLGYKSKRKFRNDYLMIAFLISAGGFGIYEGFGKNAHYGLWCFYGFVALNSLIHITYSIYPYLLGRKYNNWFFLFLPIGMLLHSFHNFIIDNIWDNKWVTLLMVTFLLLPILFMERMNFYKIVERIFFDKFINPRKVNIILFIIFILFFIYIFLCVGLRFL